MHALLVIGFLVLVILRFTLHDGKISFSGDKLNFVTSNLFYYATVYPNTIIKVSSRVSSRRIYLADAVNGAKVYTVPALFIVQKLAFRRNLRVKQSLTSLHDKSSAWLGLGATAPVIWRYRDLFPLRRNDRDWRNSLTAFGGIFCVLVYLVSGLLLALVAPELITTGDTAGNVTNVQHLVPSLLNIGPDENQYVFFRSIGGFHSC